MKAAASASLLARLSWSALAYLDNLQKMLSHQYYVVFEGVPRKKAGFERTNIQTELSNSELEAPDNVWVRGAGK